MDKKAEIELLNKEVERLRTIATVHKEFICNSDITPINLKNNTKDGSIISLENKNNEVAESLEKLLSFKSKFDLLESPLILFPDQELINKLVQLGFSSEITKWFVKIDDLLEQLNRLNNNESIIIDSLKCFNLIFTHLRMGFLIALIKGFDFIAQYENNKDSNIVNRKLSLLTDRIGDEEKGISKINFKNDFDKEFFKMYNNHEIYVEDKKFFRDSIRQSSNGKFNFYINMLKFRCY